jgi:hypothetical protein
MALRKCGGCAREIGANAAVCPQCGEPAPKETSRFTLFVVVAICGAVLVSIVTAAIRPDPVAVAAAAVPVAVPVPVPVPVVEPPKTKEFLERKAKNLRLIERMQEAGLIGGLECAATQAAVVVRPRFYALDFKPKRDIAGIVYLWCFDTTKAHAIVGMLDSKTHKHVGTFSMEKDLEWY